MKFLFSITFLWSLFLATPIHTQNEFNGKQQELSFQIGWRFNKIQDQRLSALSKSMGQAKFGIIYQKTLSRRQERLEISYSGNRIKNVKEPLHFQTIMPQINYSLHWKKDAYWIGAFFDSFVFLNYPKSIYPAFTNNPISYTMNYSLGPSIRYGNRFLQKDNSAFNLDAGLQAGLINYLVRPAFAHPYPEQYLKAGTFRPDRVGMGKAMMKSGKIKGPARYQMLRVTAGIHYYHKDQVRFGIQYEFQLQSHRGQQNASVIVHDISLISGLLFN